MKISSVVRGYISRFTDAVYFFPAIAVVLLGIAWISTFHLIRSEYAAARQSMLALGPELLETYEAQVLRSLKEIDQSLKIVRYVHESNGHADTLQTLEAKDLLPPTVVFSVCIIDSRGRVISSTDTGHSCVSNDEFLQELQQTDALVISNPRNSSASALSFGRRLNDKADGGGAVIITVEPAYFVSGYDAQKYGNNGLNALMGVDGEFRTLRIGDRISAGEQAGDIQFFGTSNGNLQTHSDGIQRYTFARPLFGYPLIAVVGLAEQEQFAEARENVKKYLRQASIGSGFLVLVFAALFRESRLLSLSRKREREQAAQVEYMAYHDTLTGLANRSLFSTFLQQELLLAKRHDHIFSVLFLDLDKFKQINDTLGHDAGDELLIQVAQRLKSCLRSSDVVARIGGDEFVALLHCLKGEDCGETVARKIISTVAEPYNILGHELKITISIGISMYPQHGLDEHMLMKNADIAMYYAKALGRNNYRIYSSDLPQGQQS